MSRASRTGRRPGTTRRPGWVRPITNLRVIARVALALVVATGVLRAQSTGRRPDGVTPEVERSILAGIRFLVQTQNPNGSWNNGWSV